MIGKSQVALPGRQIIRGFHGPESSSTFYFLLCSCGLRSGVSSHIFSLFPLLLAVKLLNPPGGAASLAKEVSLFTFRFSLGPVSWLQLSLSLDQHQDLTCLSAHHLDAPPLSKFNLINLGYQPKCVSQPLLSQFSAYFSQTPS